jgi:hypothetical protein
MGTGSIPSQVLPSLRCAKEADALVRKRRDHEYRIVKDLLGVVAICPDSW